MSPSSNQSNSSDNIEVQRAKVVSELFRALTPILMASIGGLIGFVALYMDGDANAFGLAGTAIAGGAGLAQSHGPNSTKRS